MERRTIHGVHFLRLKGTAVERARAHALLLKEEIRSGALIALSRKNEGIIRKGPGVLQKSAFLQDAAVWLYKNLLIRYLTLRSDREHRDALRAMMEGTGLSHEIGRESLFQPDALMLLCRLSLTKHLLGELPPGGGFPACSSAVVAKDWTRAGKMLACRNQDYPMVGPWEENTTILFLEPQERDQIPHVAITTAGVHTGGLTSINREGLTLFTHAHFGKRVSLRGKPVIFIGDEIIRKARTIGEAVDITRKYTTYANWAFIVSSARENHAAVIEMTPGQVCVRYPEQGYISHTNYFHSKELQGQEALLSGAYCDDLTSRLCRLTQILHSKKGKLEPSDMTAALGDHVDGQTGDERVFGNTVSVVTTIKSAVFEPESLRFWVGTRKESPVGLGEFLEVNIERFWEQRPEEIAPRVLPGYRPKDLRLLDAIRHYRDAYRAWHMESHHQDCGKRTLEALRKAVQAYPADAHLWMQRGLISFKQNEFTEARICFQEAGKRKLALHGRQVRDLFYARCLDLLGNRQEALTIYGGAPGVRDPKLRTAYRRGMKRPYRASDTLGIIPELQFPDAFEY